MLAPIASPGPWPAASMKPKPRRSHATGPSWRRWLIREGGPWLSPLPAGRRRETARRRPGTGSPGHFGKDLVIDMEEQHIEIGSERLAVWPQGLKFKALVLRAPSSGRASPISRPPSTPARALEDDGRGPRPPPVRPLHGRHHVYRLERWDNPAMRLLNARAVELFKHATGADRGDRYGWANVYGRATTSSPIPIGAPRATWSTCSTRVTTGARPAINMPAGSASSTRGSPFAASPAPTDTHPPLRCSSPAP